MNREIKFRAWNKKQKKLKRSDKMQEFINKNGVLVKRKPKQINYDSHVIIRMSKEMKQDIIDMAQANGMGYAELIRNFLENETRKWKKNNK